MIRATWDTNALASGAIARQGSLAVLIDSWRRGEFEIVVSEHILTELDRTLRKPYFQARLPVSEREAFLDGLRNVATIVAITEPIPSVLLDRADDIVLATAISAKASYLVSGDRELLDLGSYQGVRVLSPREFAAVLLRPDVNG